MLSSDVTTFTEQEHYAAAGFSTSADLTVSAPGKFGAKVTRVSLHHLLLKRFSEDLSRVLHVTAPLGRAVIIFRTQPGPSILWNRAEMRSSSIIRRDHREVLQRSSGPAFFGSVSLDLDRLSLISAAVAGRDLMPPCDQLAVTPRPAEMAKFLRLHAAAGGLAESAPEIIAHPEAARGLEQAIIEAMIACLSINDVAEQSTAHRRHATIMRRFHAAIAARSGEAVYLPDLCAAVGVPQRTLHLCCHESLGMSPKRYLQLRRMHLARHTLLKAEATATTVTAVAASFGFWSFGRFAVEYRTLFGEAPSTTLRTPPSLRRTDFAERAPLGATLG